MNSPFFHSYVVNKSRHNKILVKEIKREVLRGPQKKVFDGCNIYLCDLFPSRLREPMDFDDLLNGPTIPLKENSQLISPVSRDGTCKAVFSMTSGKSPSPDGVGN